MITGCPRRRSRVRLLVLAGLCLVAQQTLSACPICFQIEPGAATDGVRAAVFVLIAVTGGILSACGVFLVRLLRSERS